MLVSPNGADTRNGKMMVLLGSDSADGTGDANAADVADGADCADCAIGADGARGDGTQWRLWLSL